MMSKGKIILGAVILGLLFFTIGIYRQRDIAFANSGEETLSTENEDFPTEYELSAYNEAEYNAMIAENEKARALAISNQAEHVITAENSGEPLITETELGTVEVVGVVDKAKAEEDDSKVVSVEVEKIDTANGEVIVESREYGSWEDAGYVESNANSGREDTSKAVATKTEEIDTVEGKIAAIPIMAYAPFILE